MDPWTGSTAMHPAPAPPPGGAMRGPGFPHGPGGRRPTPGAGEAA